MALTLTLTDVVVSVAHVEAIGTVAFSGTYATSGDALNWTTLQNQIDQAAGKLVSSSMADPAFGPVWARFDSNGGSDNSYPLNRGTAASNWLMLGYAGITQFTGGAAYPSSALTDVVVFRAVFRKLL